MENKNIEIVPEFNIINPYAYKGNNQMLKFIFNFQPRNVNYFELNPMHNYKISLGAFALSFLLDMYYRRRYFLIKGETIRLFALGVNYVSFYYFIVNGIRFYEYCQPTIN